MEVQEAIEKLKYIKYIGNGEQEYKKCSESIAIDMAIESLEKQEQIKKENEQLKNRCRVLTGGMLCFTCPFECCIRNDEFRGEINERSRT